MTEQEAQRIKDAKDRLDIVETRSRSVDEALTAATREETHALSTGNADEISRALSNFAFAQALHEGFGHVLIDANTAYYESVNAAELTPEEYEQYFQTLGD